jgi:hypothetical protein
MNIKHLALVLGATVALVGGGMGAVACSSSSSNPGGSSSGSGSSGSGSGAGSSSGSASGSSSGSTGEGGTGDDAGDAGTSVMCDSSIPTLHPNPPGDLYCFKGADGGTLDCVADSGTGYCCLGGSVGGGQYAPQICAAQASGCTNGAPDAGGTAAQAIQCAQISDCAQNGAPGATACCIQGASAPAVVPGCGYPKSKGGTAVVCEGTGGGAATACAAGEVQICSSQADCPTGTTCKPGKWKVFQIGFCQ